MNILITGKRDKFWKAVGAAYSKQPGVRATVMPIGSPVIATMRGTPLDAVLYAVSSEEEMELLRWILSIKPELPVIVLIPRTEERLRKEILAEGVAQVLVVTSFKPREIRKSILGSGLRALGSRKVPSDVRQQISDELHAIRSTLTAILGTAEMALKRSQPAARTRKHIKEIPQEVMEIEKILRRIHRTIKTTSPTQR